MTLEVAKAACEAFHNPLDVSQVGDQIIVVGHSSSIAGITRGVRSSRDELRKE